MATTTNISILFGICAALFSRLIGRISVTFAAASSAFCDVTAQFFETRVSWLDMAIADGPLLHQ
ncbi:MAG: hypothetical protein QOC56_380 [Alphaproteobacteria bacterium]|nr:hypothetical protein [Alphaproteobacteria bacterium]